MAYNAAPCFPVRVTTAPVIVIAAEPVPTATPPAGSGITVEMINIAANPTTGLLTDLLIEISISPTTTAGDYPIALLFSGSDGVAVKPRTLIIPVRSGF